ncbi:hypothetical protein Curi_c25400 [Gottschalkia acidurici 9a]|uniref:AAA domain-containing protein n=1 Tax=Gottschalkia acidurici (strain ATCC 7906 / DSM 604 / BCRC 14475 / CIP 104303 / KCTC 5404 / NCIMB 10678 / 9a) TaxID=1128398 RepID=K0B3S1_GOTA9|nr:DUF3696 domain-containing protein [Gottschalkia acidurici]AFS79535.1 hypothetical protein Curi_c25400 [Gottschalkia acidurici 9a]
MIKSIKVKNFKSFKKSGQIDIKKINILVGPNSSGKSSFIQGLLLLKNAIQCKMEDPTLGIDGESITYKALVYDNDVDNKIQYKIGFDESEQKTESIEVNILKDFLENIDESDIIKIAEKYREIKIKDMSFTLKIVDDITLSIDAFEVNTTDDINVKVSKDKENYTLKLNDNIIDNIEAIYPCKFYFKIKKEKLHELSNSSLENIILVYYILDKLEQNLNRLGEKFLYLESLRSDFHRIEYVSNERKTRTVGSRGQDTLLTLLDIDRKCDVDIEIKEKKENINYWLDEFELGDNIEAREVDEDKYSIMIRNKHLGIYNNILDVGIGTAQLLPIIIESVNSQKESIVIIEEPETHIHPNAQAKLADLFVDCAKKDNKKFLIETHSIFLVTQLQILVASGKISPDDIGIYYFTQDQDGTKIMKMEIAENGQFEEDWPSGFFDVHYELGRKLFEFM